MVDEVKVDGEVKIDKQTGMKAYQLVQENMKIEMYWHVKMLQQIALEFRIVVEILVEMNAGSNEDGRYGCGGVS